MGNATICAPKKGRGQFVLNLTSTNGDKNSCFPPKVDVGPSPSAHLAGVVFKFARVAGSRVFRPTESRDLWSLSHRGGDQLGLATAAHAKSCVWMQHMAEPERSMEGMKGSFTP